MNIPKIKKYICLDSIDSTNTYAKTLFDFPRDGLTVIRAKKQTGGRGRMEKSYFTDHPGGLWVSIITPMSDISAHFKYNRAISLAILESLKNIAPNASITIKWPNDVYWGDRKITGILLENIPENQNAIIVGFGINVNISMDDFPKDLRESATSALIETGKEHSIDQLLEDILKKYIRHSEGDDMVAHQLYSSCLYKKGHKATIGQTTGTFVSVDQDGRLRLEVGDRPVLLSSGTLLF
jgi:BirA family biotin operon repressor/biotin-[acetyl-CoA-carboxylase] ligase